MLASLPLGRVSAGAHPRQRQCPLFLKSAAGKVSVRRKGAAEMYHTRNKGRSSFLYRTINKMGVKNCYATADADATRGSRRGAGGGRRAARRVRSTLPSGAGRGVATARGTGRAQSSCINHIYA